MLARAADPEIFVFSPAIFALFSTRQSAPLSGLFFELAFDVMANKAEIKNEFYNKTPSHNTGTGLTRTGALSKKTAKGRGGRTTQAATTQG